MTAVSAVSSASAMLVAAILLSEPRKEASHIVALCGVSNVPTLERFKMIGEKYFKKRFELPILTASTLLVPGYVDVEEVESLAKFIAEIDLAIPYTLLAFYPHYAMADLPTTSRDLAYKCRDVAEKHLRNVRIGNVHLLS